MYPALPAPSMAETYPPTSRPRVLKPTACLRVFLLASRNFHGRGCVSLITLLGSLPLLPDHLNRLPTRDLGPFVHRCILSA